jgi:hypothetical protein
LSLTKRGIDALRDLSLDVLWDDWTALQFADFLNSAGFSRSSHTTGLEHDKYMKTLIVMMCMTGLVPLAFAQGAAKAPPPILTTAEAKDHIGDMATVCGVVVDANIKDPGIAGHGKPIFYDLDQPQPHPVFYFIAFGKKPGGFDEARAAIAGYKDKKVCVTGKIEPGGASAAFIFAADRSQVKVQGEKK